MFQKVIDKLKRNRKKLQEYSFAKSKKVPFKIILKKENNFFKMEITDYISIVIYVKMLRV